MTQIYSQELSSFQLDSLYTKFLQVRAPHLLSQRYQPIALTQEDRKCGFGIVNQVKSNFNNFTFEQRQILKQILFRPSEMQKSIISPSGFFRVHFDTTNSNGNGIPSYVPGWSIDQNVAEVAKALDSAYNFEVNFLGFPPPPKDGNAGGDDRYDIYIIYQNQQNYGYTEWENNVGPVNWTSFMVIDNEYYGFYSPGLDGMKVTVAHEFHHGIQMGNYAVSDVSSPIRSGDIFFYELTSTSMEEFVYDDVNDYYNYMRYYFNNPSRNFSRSQLWSDGYDLAVWNIYLKDNFDFNIIKQQWEMMPNERAIKVINNSIITRGSTFPYELNKFGIWTFYTGFRSVPGGRPYFEEAENYPVITPVAIYAFTPPSQMVQVNAQACSNNFLKFTITNNGDTLYSIVTNGDANSASVAQNPLFIFDYTLFSDGTSGERKLTENYSSTFNVSNSSLWSISEILNNQVVFQDSTPTPVPGSISYAYPNPFFSNGNYLTGKLIFFPADANVGDEVDLNIYNSGMQLVYRNTKIINILPGSQKGVSWDVYDYNGETPASGVYIYIIKNGEDVIKGKVVIFNE